MQRTRGKVFGVVVAIAATGLLAACGGNDSTASSTPTLTRTTAATQPPASSTPGDTAPPPAPAPAPAPESEQAPAPAPERPEPIESAPPADTSKLTDKDKKYLDALKQQGVTPSTPDIALSVAGYVCQGIASGASDQDLMTFVTAMAGSDPSFDPAKMPVEKAGQIYVSAAKQTYCQ
ncbi:hypothetical protein NBRGN_027_03150 [Nocardia brasiliensis NBRC 14402]|uniref:DUF732 domain-containing protein n=1 Tax=Nocardia brasiliensis TaxID=37326 RepID=UPI00045C6D51|nr:DUF732 domain-containing protein [Nocardia brasiliensis]GAJ80656.1 hypothetical protein NBRGN_027_03150 [Nocardia brasiliensis NBRC 14402]SUB10750.1 Protein of uncharacterised function (DUF732) [Nocardia brasiliensis]